MRDVFMVAGGSVAGFDHVRAGRNNQDAFAWHQDDQYTIAVVCDGCSDGTHSEVGALLGAPQLVAAIRRLLEDGVALDGKRGCEPTPLVMPDDVYTLLDYALRDALGSMRFMMAGMLGTEREVIRNYLLFTAVGVLIAPWGTACFSVGDGVYAVNGVATTLGPFPNNMPPYPMYAHLTAGDTEPYMFQIRTTMPTEALESVCIGTDGALALLDAEVRHRTTGETLGGIAQFWEDDRYFRNPDMVRRRLTIIGRDGVQANGDPFRLHDDTTLVTIRRRR
ncbi:MAG: protein phosphatase 2C domain-containing protein [bacterium]|nr:protein phosphatase 2C domain-containing protein [bacterium]